MVHEHCLHDHVDDHGRPAVRLDRVASTTHTKDETRTGNEAGRFLSASETKRSLLTQESQMSNTSVPRAGQP